MGAFFDYIAPPATGPYDPTGEKVPRRIGKWRSLKRQWKIVGFFWGLIWLRRWAGVDEAIQTCDDHLRYLGTSP